MRKYNLCTALAARPCQPRASCKTSFQPEYKFLLVARIASFTWQQPAIEHNLPHMSQKRRNETHLPEPLGSFENHNSVKRSLQTQ